jgi:hypothetical protein
VQRNSFSCSMHMVAARWQAHPLLTAGQKNRARQASASQFSLPTGFLLFGQ